MRTAHINIGSNIGNRKANISLAVSLLAPLSSAPLTCSDIFVGDPVGFDSPNSFLNLGVNIQTELSALRLIAELQAIEQQIAPGSSHRNPDGSYADRIIDLDLIVLGDVIEHLDGVVVPHPRMCEREFVLVPMAQILPHWRHPITALSAAEMLAAMRNKPRHSFVNY